MVKRADIRAQSEYNRNEKLAYVDGYERMYRQIMEKGQCLTIKELSVTGTDLIEAGMKSGKEIGIMLKRLLEVVLENPEKNTKEQLLELVHEWED